MASDKLRKRYNDTHWGIDSSKVWEFDDSRLPDELCGMGRLLGFVVKDGSEEYELNFTDGQASLVFDLDASQTLYCLLQKKAKREMKDIFRETDGPTYSLSQLAADCGGRQAKYRSPSVQVKYLGEAQDIYYKTHKQGDGPSTYVHRFGEEGGNMPYLGVSRDGCLWLAGGSYTVPSGGVTN